MQTSFRNTFVTMLLILLAVALRLYQIQSQSLWFDEGWSAYAAAQPTLLAAAQADLTNPPLYYMLLHVHTRFFGDSEFSLRWFSLLLGLLTVPLAYQLGRRLFFERAGRYAALLAALSPLLGWASQEARMYTLLAVLVLVAAVAWHQLFRRPTRWAWTALLLSELALLYAHNTGPVAALWLNGVTLLAWIFRRNFRRPPIITWIAGQMVVGLLWLPWFLTQFLKLQEANSAVNSAPELGFPIFNRIWQAFWAGAWAMVDQNGVVVLVSVVALLLLVFAPWRKAGARWMLAHIVLLIGGLLLGLGILGNELHGRYLGMVAPLLMVLVGAAIAQIPIALLRYAVSIGLIVGCAAILMQSHSFPHDDARGMVRYYADTLTANDTVLAWSYADRYELAYYWDQLGVRARRVTLPEGGDLDSILPLLPASGDVALNVWYTQRADYRGMMACLLGNGTANLPETFTVYGMSNLLYRSPNLDLSQTVPFEGHVLESGQRAAQVSAVGVLSNTTADHALCLPIEITLSNDTEADFKAAVIVRNRYGWEIARADAVFATANQRTTSQLASGEGATAYPLIWLPLGTPPGDYDVRLRVYDEQRAESGYDLTSPISPIASKDLPLGTWRVLPGADWEQVNRETDLPVHADVRLSENLRLVAHDIESLRVYNGGIVPITLLWEGEGVLPPLVLAAEDNMWSVEVPSENAASDGLILDWRQMRVPLDATAGGAELRLPDGTVVGRYVVENQPFISDEPPSDVAVNVEIPGVGTLVGYTIETDTIDRSRPLPVTLVWRAGDMPVDTSYTVFVQLLQDQLVAQSDSLPVRPTTGWRAGEYVVDAHNLTFNERAVPGSARLIVGMYDAVTGIRIPIGDSDYIELPGTVEVK